MASSIWTILAVMTFAGAFGGLVNYFIERRDSPEKSSMLRSLVVGIGASYLVPLFLNMISSDLMRQLDQDAGKLLVFIGFCLIAAITSSAFIRSLSDKVLQKAAEAKRLSKELSESMMPILAREMEPPLKRTKMENGEEAIPLDPEARKTLDALGSGKFAWRTIDGLQQQMNLDQDCVEKQLEKLLQGGYVVCREDAGGIKRWGVAAR